MRTRCASPKCFTRSLVHRFTASCGARARVEIQPLLRLPVADAGYPYGLASREWLEHRRGDIFGQRQSDSVGALDPITVAQAHHSREAALIADQQAPGTG